MGKIDVDPFDPESLNRAKGSSACLRAHVWNDLDQLLQFSGFPLFFTRNLSGDALNPRQGPVEQEFSMISGEVSSSFQKRLERNIRLKNQVAHLASILKGCLRLRSSAGVN